MADTIQKVPENVAGQYAVNSECIDCDLCRQYAPQNFFRQAQQQYSYVAKQPANPREQEECAKALRECPVGAIETAM